MFQPIVIDFNEPIWKVSTGQGRQSKLSTAVGTISCRRRRMSSCANWRQRKPFFEVQANGDEHFVLCNIDFFHLGPLNLPSQGGGSSTRCARKASPVGCSRRARARLGASFRSISVLRRIKVTNYCLHCLWVSRAIVRDRGTTHCSK
jgi:hypothetical protein